MIALASRLEVGSLCTFQHASQAEYRAFLQTHLTTRQSVWTGVGFYRRFVRAYPTFATGSAAPCRNVLAACSESSGAR